jgi:NAD(P)-dependent dehydrogenase (short-subunit alcohol dehydrogenase family)
MTRTLASEGIEAVSLHPGVCRTKLLEAGFPGSAGDPPERCSRNEVRLATEEKVVSGGYYDRDRIARPSRLGRDPETFRQWLRLLQSLA